MKSWDSLSLSSISVLAFVLFWTCSFSSFSQVSTVFGRVMNRADMSSVPYASILIENRFSTVTDENGVFTIALDTIRQATILFSSVGFSDTLIVLTNIRKVDTLRVLL